MTALGMAASSFVCSSTGTSGVCQGTTQAAQRAFTALQTEINRVGSGYGVTKLAVDGKLGPKTLSALLMLVDRLQTKLGASLDRTLDMLLIESDEYPTTPRTVAMNVEAITAALSRDGATEQPWGPYTVVKDVVNTFMTNAGAAVQAAQTAPAATVPTPTTVAPALVDPYAVVVTPARPGMPLGLKLGLGAAAVAIVAGVTAALTRSRRSARVAGVGCACTR